MACSYSVVFNKDNRQNKSGKHSIQIRVTYKRSSKYFSVGHKIDSKYWSGKEGAWVKRDHPLSFELNSIIKRKIAELQKFELQQHLFNNQITLLSLSKFFERKGDRNSFNDYAEEFIRNLKGKSLNTIKVYNTFLKRLNEFSPRLNFGNLNEQFFHSFAKWLHLEKGNAGNSVHKYFKPLRMACKQAVKDGMLDKDPFFGVSISDVVKPNGSKKRVYLEYDEIIMLRNLDIPDERADLKITLEHWLFCFYAGFYYNDLKRLTWDDVKNSDLGYYIMGNRYKNGRDYLSPIHKFQHAVEIINRRKGIHPTLIFPDAISEQKYNDKLKELIGLTNIKKNLMNKTARHSFIQFWESKGLATQHVMKMVGHTKESTTKNYFEFSIRDVNEQVSRINII